MTTKVFPTPAALREMREAAAARAYPDPWEVDGDAVIVVDDPDAPRGFPTFSCVAECPTPRRASFVAHTRTDVPALVARVRDLAAKLDASAQAFDALVADVWRATGETHEPPADVGALVARVAAARREGAEAMREQCAQAAARVASAWARCECRCACGSSLAGLAAAEACTAEIRALPIVEAP